MSEPIFLDAEFNLTTEDKAVLVKVRLPDGTIVFGKPVRPLDNAAWRDPRDPFGTAPKDPDFEAKHPRDRKGEFTDKGLGSETVKTADGKRRNKAKVAAENYKAVGVSKIAISKRTEWEVAAAIGGANNPDYEPFDVEHPNCSIECKTFIDQKNDKVTIHGAEDEDAIGAMTRKLLEAQRTRKVCALVVHDVRNGRDDYWVRAGVGSFELKGMTKLKNLDALNGWINKNRKAMTEFYQENIERKKFTYRFGLTLPEALKYNSLVQSWSKGLSQQDYMAKVRAHAQKVLKEQMAKGRCNARGQAIDRNGKVL